jgi:hypothetical protein
LILEFYCFVTKIPAFGHLLEIAEFKGLDVKLENFLIEAFTPASSKDINMFALSNSSSIRERKEQFS